MIFYSNQLMKDEGQIRLFSVSNPVPFENYDDHEAGIYIQLHELITSAIRDHEDPIALLEAYLETTYRGSLDINEITGSIFHSGQMGNALHGLQERWQSYDGSVNEEESYLFGGHNKAIVRQIHTDTTLLNYLEALSARQ